MADKTPTTAMAHAPATARKTTLIAAIQAVLDEIDGTVTDSVSGNSQAWTVAIAGTPTGGTYTITLTDAVNGARTTSALAYNANAAAVQAALRLLSGTGLSLTTVSASGSTPNFTHTIQFKGTQAAITVTVTDSTTGGTHSVTPTQTVAFAALPKLSANSAVVLKNNLVNWAEDLASNLKRT